MDATSMIWLGETVEFFSNLFSLIKTGKDLRHDKYVDKKHIEDVIVDELRNIQKEERAYNEELMKQSLIFMYNMFVKIFIEMENIRYCNIMKNKFDIINSEIDDEILEEKIRKEFSKSNIPCFFGQETTLNYLPEKNKYIEGQGDITTTEYSEFINNYKEILDKSKRGDI